MTLDSLKIGEAALITAVGGEGALRQHFLDMGVIPGVKVKVLKYAPMGDPIEIMIHGYKLTIRMADAAEIEVEPIDHSEGHHGEGHGRHHHHESGRKTEHPGLGEGGRFHSRKDETPLPEGTILTYALVGNQNSGKTTLFNQLTGANQHVGNFPGVTVDRKDGPIRGHANTMVTDLPGIYSMSPYSSEELVSRNFVLNEHPKALINIVDATNIERNLYLTMQLIEMDIPMVVALNMMDEVVNNKGSIDVNLMEEMLGVPVIPIAAVKNQGIHELVEHAIHIAYYQEKPLRQDFCDETEHGGAIHRCLHAVMHMIEDHATAADIPVRFAASKIVEGDQLILDQLKLDDNEKEAIEHIVLQMEKESSMDRSAAIADMRYDFIRKVCSQTVVHPDESKEHIKSEKIDRILTGKYTAIPMFIIIMGAIFFLTFNVIGSFLQDLLDMGISALTDIVDNAMTAANVNEVLHGLVVKGIFAGVGSVLSFIPIIVILFLFLSLLEDSGYIARVAFFMDKILRKIGLSGKSIVPLLIGFGCTVPAVMATRTLPSERDRKMTILLTPFMSCTAKMPIFGFFIAAFFPKNGWLVMTGMYFLGIVIGILIALLFKKTLFRGEPVPFVMELPNYRMPGLRSVLQLMWDKTKDFLKRAFTVILIASIVVWFMQSFSFTFSLVSDSSESIMATLAGFIAPIFKPVGLGDWRIVTSLISGFMAKESVVTVMEVLFGNNIHAVLTAVQAAAMLVFSLLYTPCIAAVTSIRRELGVRWAFIVIFWQCLLGWVGALIVNLIGGLF